MLNPDSIDWQAEGTTKLNIDVLVQRIEALENRVAVLEAKQSVSPDLSAQMEINSSTQTDPKASPEKSTVLLVDDEPMIIDIAKQMLEVKGYDVIVATSGEDCIRQYKTHQNRVDLVLLDLIMPEMSGGETYEQLKAIDPGVKVLVSSGFGTCGDTDELIQKGCLGFIQKPFTLKSLTEKLQEIFGSD